MAHEPWALSTVAHPLHHQWGMDHPWAMQHLAMGHLRAMAIPQAILTQQQEATIQAMGTRVRD
jgi:hypothetical protein